jgi:hypothetical protein
MYSADSIEYLVVEKWLSTAVRVSRGRDTEGREDC